MNARLVELIRRRERLLVRAEAQRGELSGIVRQWHTPITVIDRVMGIGQKIKAHPILLLFPLVALAVWRPSRLVAWAGRGWMIWRVWSSSPLLNWLRHDK